MATTKAKAAKKPVVKKLVRALKAAYKKATPEVKAKVQAAVKTRKTDSTAAPAAKRKPNGKSLRATDKVDLTVYQVFRDMNGVAYLRVALTKTGALFVVNKAFQVELIDMHAGTCKTLDLRAVPNASILEAAKRLLQPLNDQTTISQRAKEHLTQILENKELENMSTAAKAKPAKFATVTAPAAKGSKKPAASEKSATKAAAQKKATAKTTSKKAPATAAAHRANLDDQQIKFVAKENGCREGTFCFAQVEAFSKSKTVGEAQKKLDASGLNPNKRRIEVAWAVKNNYIKLVS